MAENVELLQTFRFVVHLTRSDQSAKGSTLGDGSFSECSGLTLEADVKEYLEGGRNNGVVRRVGRVKLVPIVLKRGMFRPLPAPPGDHGGSPAVPARGRSGPRRPRTRTGPTPPCGTGSRGWCPASSPSRATTARSSCWTPPATRVLATWTFERGLPQKVTGPTLNAKTGEIAVEEIQIVHEGLLLGGPGT